MVIRKSAGDLQNPDSFFDMELTKIRFKCFYGSDIIILSIVTGINTRNDISQGASFFDDLYEVPEK